VPQITKATSLDKSGAIGPTACKARPWQASQ